MIRLPSQIRDAIIAHARFCAPHEACGLLALDESGSPRMVYCLTNVVESRHRFTVSPQEHLRAMQHAECNGWTIGGVFHSHPRAAARPSPTDIAEARDPTWIHLIAGPLTGPEVRAFHIRDGLAHEIPVAVE